jgi:N-acetylglucosaminyl-diphospho-decaprenol L-rhamnosyltransferase
MSYDSSHTQIDCIVVNYRSASEVECLLDSFLRMQPRVVERLVVVDNASDDDSVDRLQTKINELGILDWVTVVYTQRNAGFGAGNNVGSAVLAKQEKPCKILWLLNPDTLVDQTDLNWALKWFESDPEIGIVGTAMVDDQGQPSLSGRRDLSAIGEFVSNAGAFGVLRRWVYSDPALDRPGPVVWVSGASLLIRRNVFEQLGGFDEGFFFTLRKSTSVDELDKRAGR